MRRALRFVVHNWPLKVGAVALATLLYGGFVLSQSADNLTSPVRIEIVNAPADVVVLSNPGAVTRIRYVAPTDLGLRVDSTSFRATVDLEHVDPTGGRVPLDVTVSPVDPKIQVLDFEPRRIVLQLDRKGSKTVPIRAVLDPIPSGLEAGTPIVDGTEATVTGPQSVVAGVTEVQAPVSIDASGIDVDQLVTLVPIGSDGAPLPSLTPVDVSPASVRVQVPVFTDRRSKTIPVDPTVTGKPAAGFEIASVEVDPPVVSVEGDANDLAGLGSADTAEVSISNASSAVTQSVALALPDGVQALGSGQVVVTIRLRPVLATRTFQAGLILVGARPDLRYELSTDRVVVTLGGPIAELDRLSGSTFVLTVDVTGLGVGTHTTPVSANLTTGVSLQAASPNPIQVIVSTSASSPAPTAGGSPAP